MKRRTKPRFWTVGVTFLALFSFLAGASLACFHKGSSAIVVAEDCCQSHCQHAMVGDMAAKCCQSHQTKVAQAFPVTPAAKAIVLAAPAVHSFLVLPVVLQGSEQFWAHLSTAERSPPSPPFYTLHCALLI